jgi:hypothetical protein
MGLCSLQILQFAPVASAPRQIESQEIETQEIDVRILIGLRD